ncbi:MAG: hypothetical protein FJ335_01005 [Sphingomonadales bacterium]|nr:hypothetical protein [Sphingomonadales bacterium]
MDCRKHVLLIVTFLSASPAWSQSTNEQTKLIDRLAACLEISDDRQRLACTDTAARTLVDAVRKKDIVVVDRDEVRSTRRSLFGFALPRIGIFGREGPEKDVEEIDELEARIVRVAALPSGKYTITIEGGARWTTIESWTREPLPVEGATLKIKRAALGSYFVKVGSSRAIRAMRVG